MKRADFQTPDRSQFASFLHAAGRERNLMFGWGQAERMVADKGSLAHVLVVGIGTTPVSEW